METDADKEKGIEGHKSENNYNKRKYMNYNQYKSNQGWINFNYPSNMINVEEDEGTYLFYTEQTGSFRITPLKLEGNSNFDSSKYLKDLSTEYNGEILQNPTNKYVYYLSHSEDNGDSLAIFNWIFAINDKIVYCSYTIDTKSMDTAEIVAEKKEIYDQNLAQYYCGTK